MIPTWVLILVFLASLPLLQEMRRQGKINIDKQPKKNRLFEEQELFESSTESEEDSWKYNP